MMRWRRRRAACGGGGGGGRTALARVAGRLPPASGCSSFAQRCVWGGPPAHTVANTRTEEGFEGGGDCERRRVADARAADGSWLTAAVARLAQTRPLRGVSPLSAVRGGRRRPRQTARRPRTPAAAPTRPSWAAAEAVTPRRDEQGIARARLFPLAPASSPSTRVSLSPVGAVGVGDADGAPPHRGGPCRCGRRPLQPRRGAPIAGRGRQWQALRRRRRRHRGWPPPVRWRRRRWRFRPQPWQQRQRQWERKRQRQRQRRCGGELWRSPRRGARHGGWGRLSAPGFEPLRRGHGGRGGGGAAAAAAAAAAATAAAA